MSNSNDRIRSGVAVLLMLAVFLVVALAGSVPVAQAAVVTTHFTGTVTYVSGSVFGITSSAGQQVAGTITYDTSLPAAYNTGSVAGYIQPPPSGMSLVISGHTFNSDTNSSFQVLNNAYGCDNINGAFGMTGAAVYFNLTDFTQTVLSSTALPLSLNAASFTSRSGSVFDGPGTLFFSIDTLEPPSVPVTIDVKPGDSANSINPSSQGVTPVAILGTNSFDVTKIDAATVRFGKAGTEAAPSQWALEDANGDGRVDMILHFDTQKTGITCGDTAAVLTGKLLDGQAIKGSDAIQTVGCK